MKYETVAAVSIIVALLLPKWAIIAVGVGLAGFFGYRWWKRRKP